MAFQCISCGTPVADGSRFCSSCGKTIPPDGSFDRFPTVPRVDRISVKPLDDPAVTGTGPTKEVERSHGQLHGASVVAPRSRSLGVFAALVLIVGAGGVGLFVKRHMAATTPAATGQPTEKSKQDFAPLPPNLKLDVMGPAATFAELCRDLETAAARREGAAKADKSEYACVMDPKVQGVPSETLKSDDLGGSWERVQFVRSGPGQGAVDGEIRLALRTTAGWFVSGELVDLSAGKAANVPTELRLRAKELSGAEGRELSGVAAHRFVAVDTNANERDVLEQTVELACALEDSAPRCIAVRTRWRSARTLAESRDDGKNHTELRDKTGSLAVEFGSDGTLSIKAQDGASARDRAVVGKFRW